MESRRREEIEAKKNRLAELRRLRELRQQQQTHSRQPDNQHTSRKDLYEYVDSLVAGKIPSPSQSPSPSIQAPGSAESQEKTSIEDVRQELTFFSMDIADFPSESTQYTEVITYDKQVQTADLYTDDGFAEKEEVAALPQFRSHSTDNHATSDDTTQTANAAVSTGSSDETAILVSDGNQYQFANKATESLYHPPIVLADDKYKEINVRSDFNEFLNRASKVAERIMDEEYDVLVDYGVATNDAENEQAEEGLKQIADLQHPSSAYKRAVTDIEWSSKFPELVLGSFTASSSLSASPGGLVQVWNMHMRERPEYNFQASSDVLTARFSPFNPNIIMGGCYNGQVLLWDMRSNEQPVMSSPLSVVGHSFPVYCLEMAGTENLYNILSCSTDGTVCSWAPDLLAKPTNKIVLKLPTIRAEEVGPTSMALSASDPDNFFIGTEEGSIYACYLADRAGVKAGLDASLAYAGAFAPVTGLDIHPFARDLSDSGALMISSSMDWDIRIHQILDKTEILQQQTQHLMGTNGTDNTTDISSKLNNHQKVEQPLLTFNCTEAPYDVKWNPARASVFASVDAGGYLEIRDLLSSDTDVYIARARPQHERGAGKIRNKSNKNNIGQAKEESVTDNERRPSRALNKVAWEKIEGRRLATGGLDGIISIFDSSPCLGPRPSMSSEDWTRMRKLLSKARMVILNGVNCAPPSGLVGDHQSCHRASRNSHNPAAFLDKGSSAMLHVGANNCMLLFLWSISFTRALKLHADLYASPKYAINFSMEAISEEELPVKFAQLGSSAEQLTFGNRKTLCSIPADNLSTISDLKDEELQSTSQPVDGLYEDESSELLAIQENGWKLLQSLKGHCLYYTLNYFTYSLCFGDEVRQFRAISHKGLIPYPPIPDPGSANFLLGRFSEDDWKASTKVKLSEDMPYISQKIGHGTICDLTEKERNVEVQYFCNLDTPNDKIVSITEVSTCNYRMVVHTRKLCADPSFLPAKQGPPLYIVCWPILNSTEFEQYNKDRNDGHLTSTDLMVEISKSFGLTSPENGLEQPSKDQSDLRQKVNYEAFKLQSIDEQERINTFMSNIMEMILFKLADLLVNEDADVRLALNEGQDLRVIAIDKNSKPVAIVGIQDRDNHLVAFMGDEPLSLKVDTSVHKVITMLYDAQEKILEVIETDPDEERDQDQQERTMSFDNADDDEHAKLKAHDEL